MTAQPVAMTDQIQLSVSKTRRDFKLSLALLVTGVILSAGIVSFELWANSTGYWIDSPTGPSAITSALLSAIGGIGSTLVLVGAIFAAINWSLLRKAGSAT